MENRNEIKKRMFSNAAKSWGITPREMETIDPLITMLIDACANELENVSASVDEVGRRIGIKLMELLTPELLISPVPARAVLHAHPFESTGKISPEHEFYYYKRNPLEQETTDLGIYFTPVKEHKIFSGEIEYIATGNALYRIDEFNEKSLICKNTSRQSFNDSLWLGLSLNRSISDLSGLSFFFEIENVNDIQEKVFYQALKTSTWKASGRKVSVQPGFYDIPGTGGKKQIKLPYAEFNKSSALIKQVLSAYKKHFISFSDISWDAIINQDSYMNYPPLFGEMFEPVYLNKIDKKLIWMEVSFTDHMPRELADHVKCTLNGFPVVARRKEKCVITGNDRIKELRASSFEVFYDLADVSCNEPLEILLSGKIPENMEGKALLTLRKDNIARFNTANAVEQIQQMIESYHSEHATFSKIKGIERDTIDKLYDAVRPFEYAVDHIRSYTSGSSPYLMLKADPAREDAEVEVTYYLTTGSLGNGINKGIHINFDSAELIRNTIFLVTPTTGGSDIKRDEDLVRSFRYALLTNGRLVTLEDIKALCDARFGRYAESIEVKKGVGVSAHSNSGLQRIIEISIRLRRDAGLAKEEIKFLKEDLEQELEEKSANVLPVRVRIE